MLVRKKDRKALEPHSWKCIFVGYPEGTKAWRFWDPAARRFIISSHAVFDERCFPGNSPSINVFGLPLDEVDIPGDPAMADKPPEDVPDAPELPDQGGDDWDDPAPPAPPAPPAAPAGQRERSPAAPERVPSPPAPPAPAPVVPQPPAAPAPAPALHAHLRAHPFTSRQRDMAASGHTLHWLANTSLRALPASRVPSTTRSSSAATLCPSDSGLALLPLLQRQSPQSAATPPSNTLLRQTLSSMQPVEPEPAPAPEPAPPAPPPSPASSDDELDLLAEGHEDVYECSLEAMLSGIEDVYCAQRDDYVSCNYLTYDNALAFAFESVAEHALKASQEHFGEPRSISEVMQLAPEERDHWLRAAQDEIQSLDGSIERYKGRLVAKGFSQRPGFDYNETFAPTPKWASIRIILALAALEDLKLESVDISSAYLSGELKEEVYMKQPEGFEEKAKRSLSILQRQYALDILERYGFANCDPVGTPMDPGLRLSADMGPFTSSAAREMQDVPYGQAVGSLFYLANLGMAHWKAVKHLFRYIKGTLDYKLTYSPSSSDELFTSYTDTDHAGCPDTGRSTSGYVIKMGTGAISWSSRLQSIVALFTTEAEFVAAVSAGQEVLWLRNLLTEFGFDVSAASRLRINNLSALSVAKNPEHHGRMKHLDYWLRDEVAKGRIEIEHLRTSDMPADILTKSLAKPKVLEMVKMLGLGT
ncbi:hypothetical protein ACG7TL_007228 [Trametes sanguinea]